MSCRVLSLDWRTGQAVLYTENNPVISLPEQKFQSSDLYGIPSSIKQRLNVLLITPFLPGVGVGERSLQRREANPPSIEAWVYPQMYSWGCLFENPDKTKSQINNPTQNAKIRLSLNCWVLAGSSEKMGGGFFGASGYL